jgi:gliding motility-associated-like protein
MKWSFSPPQPWTSCCHVRLVVALSFAVQSAWAQSSPAGTNWYFGANAGITFTGGVPQALTNGNLRTVEGCATRSGPDGQLLLYTDGSTIWNKQHTVITDATNLGGNPYSTQSALIVPYQNSAADFYVFSVSQTDVSYARVRLLANNGQGGITEKNRSLTTNSTEKITTVYHCNNLNHWIITHERGNATFRANLINDNGLITSPIVSDVGSVHKQSKGYLQPSHDGRTLVVAVSDSTGGGFLELLDFDNTTGKITNPRKLQTPEIAGAYGVVFSPDNSLVYLSTMGGKTVYQIRVSDMTITARLTVPSAGSSPGIGALQLGIDSRIYGTQPGADHLFAIPQPNQVGSGCGLIAQAVHLGGRKAMAGLPVNVDTIPQPIPKVRIAVTKRDGCNQFLLSSKTENLDPAYLLYQWYRDGTAISGANSPTLMAAKTGHFLLKVRETKCRDIHITSEEELPVVLVEVDPTARALPDSCGAFRLHAHASGGTAQWFRPGIDPSQNRLDSLIIANIVGSQTFRARVESPDNPSCFSEKLVTVSFAAPAPFKLGATTQAICADTLTLRATPTTDWTTFSWQAPSVGNLAGTTITARQSGSYRVTARSAATGCRSYDSVRVMLNPTPTLTLPIHQIDTCFSVTSSGYLSIDAGRNPAVTYNWQYSGQSISTDPVVRLADYGVYTLTVRTSAGCSACDSLRVRSTCPPVEPEAYLPDAFTPNLDGRNETLIIHSTGVAALTLTIYDRWGEPIYHASGTPTPTAGWSTWDGTYEGQPASAGPYAYQLELKGADFPTVFTRKGVLMLLR